MRHSEQIGELAAALAKAQASMKGAVADSSNPHFKSRYADLESVRAASLPALAANGICVFQEVTETVCTTKLVHSSGQWLETDVPVFIGKRDSQGLGSAMTYSRRYALAAAVCLSQTDDDGNLSCEPPKAQPKPMKTPVTDALVKLAADAGLKAEVLPRPVFDRNSPKEVAAVKNALMKAGIPNHVIKDNKASFEEYLQIGRDFADYDEAVENFFQHKVK